LFFYDHQKSPWGYDPADRGGWAVLHQPVLPKDLLTPPASPADAAYGRVPIQFRTILSYPTAERVPSLQLSDAELDAFADLASEQYGQQPKHQLGGLPHPVQEDDMERECQFASNGIFCGDGEFLKHPRASELEQGIADWRLLLQLDSDDSAHFTWSGAGSLYFFVRESQARAGDFKDVWVVLQCG
jgi:uncharacterized protein DUF1963